MRTLLVAITALLISSSAGSQSAVTGRTLSGALGVKPKPARLLVTSRLATPSGRDVLYEYEQGSIDLVVSNDGDLTARNVLARIDVPREIPSLLVDSSRSVGNIAGGDSALLMIPLSIGQVDSRREVVLFVSVFDSAGYSVRQPLVVSLDLSASAPTISQGMAGPDKKLPGTTLMGRNWLFLIGIDDYKYWAPLQTPVRDAKAIRSVLIGKYGFDPKYLLELFDGEATREGVIKNLEYLAKAVRPEDNLLVYFAGHGKYDKVLNRGYWIPAEAEVGSAAHYLANSDLQAFIAAIQSRATLIVSDACFSGTLFRDTRPRAKTDRYFFEVSKLRARQALISGGNEPVLDSGLSSEHSVFAYYLIDRLNSNLDTYLAASTLFERIKVPIANGSQQTPQCKPIYNSGDEGGEFVFVRRK